MKIYEIITETDNETVYGRKEDGFVLSPVDPNRPKPVRKRAKWKDEEAKRIQADNAALKAQGKRKPGGREQGFLSDAEMRTIPASDKELRSLYMPHYYTKNLGNKEKMIGWQQQKKAGDSTLNKQYTYQQTPGLIDPETGKHIPIGKGSHDIANTKMVSGTKRTAFKSPYGSDLDVDKEAHQYDPKWKDTWRKRFTGKKTTTPGAHQTTNIDVNYDYGDTGMFDKEIAAVKAKRAAAAAKKAAQNKKVISTQSKKSTYGLQGDVQG